MVVEKFKPGCIDLCYQRLETCGRMLPDGLYYLNSWVNSESEICFQLMEAKDEGLFDIWFDKWKDLVSFEIYQID